MRRVAIVAFDGFDELDAFVALGLIGRLRPDGWSVAIAGPAAQLTSMNGVTVAAQQPLEAVTAADAVVFTGGLYARAIAENGALLARLQIDPIRQRVAGQGSGTLLLARLGLLGSMPACADATTRPWLVEAGVVVLDEPFHARGPVATAAGGLAAQYVAAWLMAAGTGLDTAVRVLRQAAPPGHEATYAEHVLGVVKPFLTAEPPGR